MSNPLFQQLNGGRNSPMNGNNKRNWAPALLQYMQGFQGNPIDAIQRKLNNGEMTQDQYNQLHKAAEEIVGKMASVLRRQ